MIKEFIIGIMVFIVVAIVLFNSADVLNTNAGVIVDSSHKVDYGEGTATTLISDIGSKAPGGASSEQGGGDTETDTDLGFKTGAKILQAPSIFKDIIYGNGTGTGNREGVATKLGVSHNFQSLAFSAFLLIVSLILISSLLRNVIK